MKLLFFMVFYAFLISGASLASLASWANSPNQTHTLCQNGNAETSCSKACSNDKNSQIFRCVEYVNNYDGDTITFNIPGIHFLLGRHINIRVKGIDTPEIKGKTLCEKQKAIEAKKVVKDLLSKATVIHLKNIKRGKYFRIVAEVHADAISVGDYLLKKGLAYPYNGETKIEQNWCPHKTNQAITEKNEDLKHDTFKESDPKHRF